MGAACCAGTDGIPALTADGTLLYVHAVNGTLVSADPTTGAVFWNVPVEQYVETLTIEEELFDPNLFPTQAKVNISMRLLRPSEFQCQVTPPAFPPVIEGRQGTQHKIWGSTDMADYPTSFDRVTAGKIPDPVVNTLIAISWGVFFVFFLVWYSIRHFPVEEPQGTAP